MSPYEKAPGALNDEGRKLVRDTIMGELISWGEPGRTYQQLWRKVNEVLGYERGDANAPGYRATDYALQVLRRSRKIRCQRCGQKTLWSIRKEEPCEE